jgi:hypothetical protein
MTASNSSTNEDMGSVLSCSSQCIECGSISNPEKIHDSIKELKEKLGGLQDMDESGVLSWLLEFKDLELVLLR